MCCERWSNEAATVHADITADHRDVPARFDLEIPNGHSVDRSFDGSFRVDGHAELDGPPLPFQVSLPVLLGIGTLGRRVAPLSVQYTLS